MSIRIKRRNLNNEENGFKELLKKIFSEQVKEEDFARKLYDCLCNTIWFNKHTGDIYSCSWRYAGGLVADLRNVGEDYIDFYCNGFSGEGAYHEEIYSGLEKFGYKAVEYKKSTGLQKHEFTGRF